MEDKIKQGITEKIGEDVFDLRVSEDMDWLHDRVVTKITCRVLTATIIIEKPASRLDMVKLAMPNFIQRIFKPKTVEVEHIIALPALIKEMKKIKFGALVYSTNEFRNGDPDQCVKFCIEAGSRGLSKHYMNKTFKGWK